MTTPLKIISVEEYLKNNKKPNQEEVWDNISDSWKEFRQGKIPIVEEFLFGKNGKIIDLGCGSGRNLIKNDKVEYYGVDISSKQLKNAKEYARDSGIDAKFFKSGANKLDRDVFKDEMFDYGLFIATLHCIEDKKERENALRGFCRVLKKGSEALISVWDSADKRFNGLTGDVYMSWKENGKINMRYYYLYKKEELTSLLEKVGFKIVEIYTGREKDRFSRKNWIVRIRKN